MRGFNNVFRFTWVHQVHSKGYLLTTILVAVLMFALPAGLMPLIEKVSMNSSDEEAAEIQHVADFSDLSTVYAVDQTGEGSVSLEILNEFLEDGYKPIQFVDCKDDMDAAAKEANDDPNSLVCLFTKNDNGYNAAVLTPEGSALREDTARPFSNYLNAHFTLLQAERAGFTDTETLKEIQAQMEAIMNGEYSIPEDLTGVDAKDLVNALSSEAAADGTEAGSDEAAAASDMNADAQELMDNAIADMEAGADDPDTSDTAVSEEADAMADKTRNEILSMILPFVNIMLLYFMVLAYGQGVAQSVLAEKSSKLMDTFLLYVKPRAMVLGKVFAIVLSSIMQFVIWLAAIAGGFAVGSVLVKLVNPNTDMALVRMIQSLPQLFKPSSVLAVVIAVLLVFAGFLLYCSVAAIGGAIAGKQEDLGSTNFLFTIILLISFFATLYGGGISFMGSNSSIAPLLNWVPFTSIMVLPSRLILGEATIMQGVLSLGIVLLCSVLIMGLAGRIYRALALYKGDIPSPKKLLAMMRGK